MTTPMPFFREAGQGPGVVCLHSNASTSAQWRGLMELLSPSFHVLAPDSHGAGQGPAWPQDRTLMLADEAAFIAPLLARAGTPCALVGHSYGGAVALKAALHNPSQVRALVLYEPTLFSILEAHTPGHPAAQGIRDAVADAASCVDMGDMAAAARRFIDYWMSSGSFDAMPAPRQAAVAAAMHPVRHWAHALMNEPTPLQAFSALRLPVLLMVGGQSPASSRAVAALLATALPTVTVHEFPDAGHMGPLTHAPKVNEVIAAFLKSA